MKKIQIEYVKIEDIIPYKNNPRNNDKAVEIVEKSINRNFFKLRGFNNPMPIIQFCEECGEQYKIRASHAKLRKTCSMKCAVKRRSRVLIGKNAANWRGGTETHSGGWIWVYCPEHPNAHKNKVAEHRIVMEKKIGRYLSKDEIVHHIDGVKTNNNIENLKILTRSSHAKLHHPKGKRFGNEGI